MDDQSYSSSSSLPLTDPTNPLRESLLPKEVKESTNEKLQQQKHTTTAAVPVTEEEEETETDPEDPSANPPWERGETQTNTFQDLPFAFLFHVQFLTVTLLGLAHGLPVLKNYLETHDYDDDDGQSSDESIDEEQFNSRKIYQALLLAFLSATGLMVLCLMLVLRNPGFFIAFSILFNAALTFSLASLTLIPGLGGGNDIFYTCFLFLGALLSLCYYCAVRSRIPFAAANLRAASSAVKTHAGVVPLAYAWAYMSILWTFIWIVCVYYTLRNGDEAECATTTEDDDDVTCDDQDRVVSPLRRFYFVLLLLSFYWTQQVFGNTLHTTVAGIVGTWYFDTNEQGGAARSSSCSCCGIAVWASAFRTFTYGFGSVCFGSLLVALVSMVRFLADQQRGSGRRNSSAILFCVLECLLSLLEAVLKYFNKWAFVYVGLYGYSYITAGKKVTSLFQQRGWSVIINDDLVTRALDFTNFTVALLCGTAQYLVFSDGWYFVFGFFFGLFFSCTTMSVLDSAVSTIVVCFAEAPEGLERYPEHNTEMKDAWYNIHSIRC